MGAVCAPSSKRQQAQTCTCATTRCYSNGNSPVRELSANHDYDDEFDDADVYATSMAPVHTQSVFDQPRGERPGKADTGGQQRRRPARFLCFELPARVPPFACYAAMITFPLLALVTVVLVHSAMYTALTTTTTTTATTTTTTTTTTAASTTDSTTRTTTTTATTTTATTTTTLSTVSLALTLNNLDYTGLVTNRPLCDDFKAEVQEVIASEAANGVRASHVHLMLVAGSVEVKARIIGLPSAVADAVSAQMARSRRLGQRLVATVSAMEGIDELRTGRITVTSVEVLSGNSPAAAAELAEPSAPPGFFEALFVVIPLSLLLGACAFARKSLAPPGYSQMGETAAMRRSALAAAMVTEPSEAPPMSPRAERKTAVLPGAAGPDQGTQAAAPGAAARAKAKQAASPKAVARVAAAQPPPPKAKPPPAPAAEADRGSDGFASMDSVDEGTSSVGTATTQLP